MWHTPTHFATDRRPEVAGRNGRPFMTCLNARPQETAKPHFLQTEQGLPIDPNQSSGADQIRDTPSNHGKNSVFRERRCGIVCSRGSTWESAAGSGRSRSSLAPSLRRCPTASPCHHPHGSSSEQGGGLSRQPRGMRPFDTSPVRLPTADPYPLKSKGHHDSCGMTACFFFRPKTRMLLVVFVTTQ